VKLLTVGVKLFNILYEVKRLNIEVEEAHYRGEKMAQYRRCPNIDNEAGQDGS
jgi:hypothetical protein